MDVLKGLPRYRVVVMNEDWFPFSFFIYIIL
jgi:hypothetical protein